MSKKKKKRRKGKAPAHLVKHQFKPGHGSKKKRKKSSHNHHKETSVAKRKKKRKSGGRRRGGGGRRRSHRRHSSGGGGIGGGGMNTDLILAGGGLAFGFLERKMKGDANFFLNKVPTPISFLGKTGNLTVGAYLASYLLPGKWKKHAKTAARIGAVITAYQLGRKGEAFKEGADFFAISGFEDADEHMLGDAEMDDIAGEMDALEGHHAHGTLEFDAHVDDDPVAADVHDEVDAHTSP